MATNVGRRPSLVGINRQYGCVAAVDFSSTDIRIAISNMKADMIDYGTVPGESRLNMSHLEQTIALLGEMLERHQMRERLLAISIGTPGDIDRQTGYFLYAPRFEDCTKLNLHTIFQEAFGVDVLVKNDVNLATMGENLFGAGGGCRNMLYIALDYGIGSGMILDGRLFEGARGFSGEIGLWLMDPPGGLRAVPPEYAARSAGAGQHRQLFRHPAERAAPAGRRPAQHSAQLGEKGRGRHA